MKQTKEEINQMNGIFISNHGELRTYDYDMLEVCQELMERRHSRCLTPQPGDRVEGAYYDGLYPYKYGVIASVSDDGKIRVCYEPYIPFLYTGENDEISLSISGGPWGCHKAEEFVLVEEETVGNFCRFGSSGACAHGAIYFKATVKKWRLPYQWRCKSYIEVIENKYKGFVEVAIRNYGSLGCNVASFSSMSQLDRFCERIGVTYTLEQEREGYRRYALSHDIEESRYGFWKLEQVPEGSKPIKAFCNGSIVDCFFLNEGHTVTFFKPNPNAKEVYKPLSIDEHLRHQRMNGYY